MQEDKKLLSCMLKNIEINMYNLINIISKIKNNDLNELLKKEYYGFNRLKEELFFTLKEYDYIVGITKIDKLLSLFSSNLSLNNRNNIAKRVIDITNKSIIDITNSINSYSGNKVKIVVLAKRIKSILENNTQDLKKHIN